MSAEETLVGKKFVSEGRTISEGEFTLLHNLTWIIGTVHSDKEYMKKTPFGERILGGPLILSVLMGLMQSSGIIKDLSQSGRELVAMLGLERITFASPVFPGDTLKLELEIMQVKQTSKPKREVVTLKTIGRKQTGDVVLDTTTHWMFEKAG